LIVDPQSRLPQLNAVGVPEGIDEGVVRAQLLRQYDLEIGAGLGSLAGKIWRVGLMGYGASQKNVLICLSALEAVLAEQGFAAERGLALQAANAIYRNG